MSQRVAAMPHTKAQSAHWVFQFPLRYRFVGLIAIASLFSFLVSGQARAVYDQVYAHFDLVATHDKTQIEQIDMALQSIAQVSTDALDSVITRTTDPAHSRATAQSIDTDFDQFRKILVAVDVSLPAGVDRDTFNAADQAVYDQFWPHLNAMQTAVQRGDSATVISEYTAADHVLEQIIIPDLMTIDQDQFAAMQHTEQDARSAIIGQLAGLLILSGALAIFLIALSMWLRLRLRRYVTPSLDAAMLIGSLCALAMFIELVHTPGQLKSMVEDSYYSVGAAQRILAIATQANRIESAEVLDSSDAATWQALFDQKDTQIEQAICGFKACTVEPFLAPDENTISPSLINAANQNLPRSQNAVVSIVPLVANVTYSGESLAIEQIRTTYNRYLALDSQLRGELAHGDLVPATQLDTGESDIAFSQFTAAVQHERQINADQFQAVWQQVQTTLPIHRILFGVIVYGLIIVALWTAVYQRFPEL